MKAILFLLLFSLPLYSSHKVYLIHGYAGLGLEMQKIKNKLDDAGYTAEIFTYPSLRQDVDTAAVGLCAKIEADSPDTVYFVTHSMGALVARSVYRHMSPDKKQPFIHRIVMIAPPNKGTPVADFFVQSKLARFLGGPNLPNLTTDPEEGAMSYPIPDAETGIIIGVRGGRNGYNLLLDDDNDGLIIPEDALLGNEKDLIFIKATHTGILLKSSTSHYIISFLNTGIFSGKRLKRRP